jgi:hypothetical protein
MRHELRWLPIHTRRRQRELALQVRGVPTMSGASILAADFDRARQDMLAEFRRMIAMDRQTARIEALVTAEVLLKLLEMDGGANAG